MDAVSVLTAAVTDGRAHMQASYQLRGLEHPCCTVYWPSKMRDLVLICSHKSLRRSVSEQELQEVVSRVGAQEAADDIPQWSQADAPASVLPPDQLPEPGRVVSRRELPALGATELVLSNGMRVCAMF